MKLRGHHIFCTALFSGHGYDKHFTEKMHSIILDWQQGGSARIVVGTDEVCSACPNLTEKNGCTLGTEDVLSRDAAALKVLKLAENQPLTWSKAGELLSQITREDFQAVCGSCRWQKEGLCSYEMLISRAKKRCDTALN